MKPKELLSVLCRPPLSYRVARQNGSHRRLVSDNGYPPLTFAFHESMTAVPPGLVRKILVKDVGLDADVALDLL